MPDDLNVRERKYQLYGWLLFLGCAILFIIQTAIDWNPWGFFGSLLFLAGCIAFIIPFMWKKE